jgi:hypothetical protein
VAGIVKDSTSGRNGYRGPYQLKPASHGTYPILFFAFGGDKGIKRGLFNGCQEFPAKKNNRYYHQKGDSSSGATNFFPSRKDIP